MVESSWYCRVLWSYFWEGSTILFRLLSSIFKGSQDFINDNLETILFRLLSSIFMGSQDFINDNLENLPLSLSLSLSLSLKSRPHDMNINACRILYWLVSCNPASTRLSLRLLMTSSCIYTSVGEKEEN